MVCDLEIGHKRHCDFSVSLCLSLGSLTLGEASCHVKRTLRQIMERPT